VEAYSTLGWFKDPVLNTFIFEPEAELAEIIFHELGHQRVFASGDTDFNEAFATSVGEEGARRWLREKRNEQGLEQYRAHLQRNTQFVHLVQEAPGSKLFTAMSALKKADCGRVQRSRLQPSRVCARASVKFSPI